MRSLKYLAAAAAIGSLLTLAQISSAGPLTATGPTVSEGADGLVEKADYSARKGYGHKRWHRHHHYPHRRYHRRNYRFYYDDHYYPGYYPYGYYPYYGYYSYPRPYYGGPFIGSPFISFGFGVGG